QLLPEGIDLRLVGEAFRLDGIDINRRGLLKLLLRSCKDELLQLRVDRQAIPRDGDGVRADPQEAADVRQSVWHAHALRAEQHLVDATKVLTVLIHQAKAVDIAHADQA